MPRVVKGSMSFKPAFKPKPKAAAAKPQPRQPAPAVAATGDAAGRDQNQSQERSNEATGTMTGPDRNLPLGDTIEVARSTRGGMPSGDTIEVVRPFVPRPRMASPPPSLLTPPATQTQMSTQVEDRAYSLPPFVPPPGRVPVRFERDALPPTPGPTQQDSQPQASSSRPTAPPSRSPSRSLSPQPQPNSASTSRAPFQRSPVSRHNSEPEEEHTVVPVPITIKANEFPHRMTDDQLLPTPGFVLPSLKQVGGGPRHGPPVKPLSSGSSSPREARKSTRTRGNGKGKRREGPGEGDAEEEERSMDDEEEESDDSEDAYDPQGEAGKKKRRAVKRKERARNGRDGSQEEGVEEDGEGAGAGVGVGKKRKRAKKTDMGALDPSLVAAGQQGGDSGTDDGSEDDDEDEDEETGDNSSNGNKKKTKRGKKARKAKRLRVNIRDDLDEEQLATLQPGQAIGEEIDEETMTMADLAAGPGQGRISGKAIKIQQGREEIQRRKEEEQERRIRFRVERETRMRGVGGQAAKQAAAAENEDHNEGAEGEQADGAQAGQAGEQDQEEEDIEDYDMNEKGDGDENMDVDGNNVDTNAEAGDLDLDEDDDDQEFIVNQHARGFLQLDENGNMIVNTQLNRQQILNESMNEGNVFEDNDDLKFTNSMSHSKRASVIRWTKPMNNKLMTLLRQHGPVYETIAKIMALTYPAMERTHVANHMRTLNAKDPELLTWALSKENKLEIDMNELKQVYPGIDFEAPLPDITMYFNPNIDPSEIRAMKRKQAASNKPMTEQDKKKQARRAALSKKKQEKMRQMAMMGTVEEGEEVGDEELAAMRRQPGLPL